MSLEARRSIQPTTECKISWPMLACLSLLYSCSSCYILICQFCVDEGPAQQTTRSADCIHWYIHALSLAHFITCTLKEGTSFPDGRPNSPCIPLLDTLSCLFSCPLTCLSFLLQRFAWNWLDCILCLTVCVGGGQLNLINEHLNDNISWSATRIYYLPLMHVPLLCFYFWCVPLLSVFVYTFSVYAKWFLLL